MSDAHLHRIHSDDDVAVTFSALKPGEFVELDDQRIQILGNVPKFHKVSIKPIMKGQKVRKYGEHIGLATQEILVGEHVHIHNMKGLSKNE